ncbi:hypothetical protein JAAARDRAFT_67915 [Jaapia argillacea MUCL 33604]|uniref:DUF6533 domain-containing protein n=1 Tax=Jaapia argillacea MUCL 33604 TaxID=933084 RepID=A0A067QCR0_9AGAM|nr:hypothetical protein JAAARDRAFT_67915 [Jaapia argillacea MUCL 33604]
MRCTGPETGKESYRSNNFLCLKASSPPKDGYVLLLSLWPSLSLVSSVFMDSAFNIAAELVTVHYITIISLGILYYDYALTLSMEVERFWRGGFSRASFLFFLNRYLGLSGHIPTVIQTFCSAPPKRCTKLNTYHRIFYVILQIVIGALLSLRTHALYDRARWVIFLVCGVGFTAAGVGWWGQNGSNLHFSPISGVNVGCNPAFDEQRARHIAVAWGAMSVFDTLIFLLTAYKALSFPRTGRRTLFDVLLRDGTMYFLIIVTVNIANILVLLLGQPLLKPPTTTFTNIISTTLTSRLMLNVRDPLLLSPSGSEFATERSDRRNVPQISTVIEINQNSGVVFTGTHQAANAPQEGEGGDIELVRRSAEPR